MWYYKQFDNYEEACEFVNRWNLLHDDFYPVKDFYGCIGIMYYSKIGELGWLWHDSNNSQ